MEKIEKDYKYQKNNINLVFCASNVAPSIFRAYFAFHRMHTQGFQLVLLFLGLHF